MGCLWFLIEGIYRLTPIRFLIGTLLIKFELYHYTNPNKTLWNKIVLFLYATVSIISLPIILMLILNELIVSLFASCYKKCDKKNAFVSANDHKKNNPSLRVMSYNIQSGCGMDGKLDMNRIKNVIKDTNPDILCMQEVEWESNRYPSNQNDDVAEYCGLNYKKHLATRAQYKVLGGGYYGDAIATKYPILDEKLFNFPHWPLRNPRKIIALKLDISSIYPNNYGNNTPFLWVVCTHLQNDISFDENWYQAKLLASFCQEICKKERNNNCFRGLIAAGDFNVPSWSSAIQYLSGIMIECVEGASYPASNPKVQLDHFFLHYSSRFRPKDDTHCIVVDNADASDHRAILTVIEDVFHVDEEQQERVTLEQ